MKRLLHTVFVFVALLVPAATTVSAATAVAAADIPFAFTVNGVTLAPGKYLVERTHMAGVLALQAESGKRVMISAQWSPLYRAKNSAIVFEKAGRGFTMSELRIQERGESYAFPKGHRSTGEKIEISLLRP
jgi:hypothetical protein